VCNKIYILLYSIGLDAAAPGYEAIPIHLPHLNKEDAQFVDCIHTSRGILGYFTSIGHADFYPNSGRAPQPGCYSLFSLLDFCKYFVNLKRRLSKYSHELYC